MTDLLRHRNFLLKAFHPYGHMACNSSGLMPASVDVMEKELAVAERIFLPEIDIEKIWEYAGWYADAADELVDDDVEDYDRDLREDLVAFYIAMKAEEDS